MNPFYGVKLLQKERDDYRRMWIEALSQADRAEVNAKQDRDRLVAEVRRFAGELSAESYVYRQVASRLLDLLDHAAAPVEAPATRCTSCDHTIDMHQSDGCWYTVETGVGNLVCVCSVSAQEQ